MSGTQDENPPPPPPPSTQQTPTQQTPHTVSTIKLPILKKGEYDIWAMKMEHYLAHTDYPIWEVIQNGNGPVSVTTDTSGQIKILPPKTAEEIVARERERKARTTLLMAIPEDHLAKFHKMTDAKEMWNAIKSRFGGNDESKKMQKYILKQQFEGFTVSNTDGIHKGYERFQSLLSQLEIHGAGVSTEDANQKFLRSLPSAWLQVSLIMRNKPGMDSLSFDDLYNNLRVFENDVKGSTASSSNLQNVAFVSENTSSTNDVSTAYGVSNTSGHNSKHEQTSSYSLLASQSSCPQLDHEDLDQVDEYDLEEMDLKWQVAMISMRIKKFYKKTCRKLQFDAKEPVGFDKTKVECYNCHKTGHFVRECRTKEDNRKRDGWNPGNKDGSRTGKKEEFKALVTVDGESVDWTTHSEDDEKYAFMDSNSSGSDTQDAQREELSNASVEIKAYTQALKKVEAQLVAHQAQKEKEDLKAKVEKWHNSSKNLSKLLNTQMSANDKFGLGYGDHRYDGILSYENEVLQSVFMNKESELAKQPLYDRCHLVLLEEKGKLLISSQQVVIGDHKDTTGTMSPNTMVDRVLEIDYPHRALKNKGSKGYITGKGKIKTGKLDFEDHKDCFVLPIWTSYSSTITPDLKTDAKRACPSEEEQVFLDELERLKRQEKEANEEVEALRKKFAQDTKNLVIQAGAAKDSSTNIFSAVNTPAKASSTNLVNTVSTPISTGSSHEGLSLSDPTNPEQDDSEIPPLEDIYQNLSDCLFLLYIHLNDDECEYYLILRDHHWAVQTRCKVGINVLEMKPRRFQALKNKKLVVAMRRLLQFRYRSMVLVRSLHSPPIKCCHREFLANLIGNPQQEVVNFLAGDSFLGNAKSKPLWLLLLWRQNMLLLQAAVGKFCGFKIKCLRGFRESLRRVIDGTEALLLPTLFILWLDTVSTDSAKLVPLGKVCTAIETLKKNTAKALISLLTTTTLKTTMAVLDLCPKHNMVAYLEKTEGNTEFHEIIDFLTRSSIHHALTVSPIVSTTFVEQFWTSAKSKIINNVRHITAKVAGKPVSISEASIRSDLLFDDANE
ncbi:ribonuclease H-like domain-containing protein [Tanacetum coccineum]